MRKIFAILIVLTALTACQTEPLDPSLNPNGTVSGTGTGTNPGNTTASIVGDWDYDYYETITTTTTTFNGNTVDQTASNELVSTDAVISFRADGTYDITGDMTFDVIVNGMSTGNQTASIADNGTYTLTGTTLEMVPASSGTSTGGLTRWNEADITIATLTATDLTLDIDSQSTQMVNGATITITIDGYGDFIRQ